MIDLHQTHPAPRMGDVPRLDHLGRFFLLAAVAYAALLVYASLVPFAFHPFGLAEAWVRFRGMPFLTLGPESRADWIANLVAYVPLGFLLAASAGGQARISQRGFAVVGSIAICWILAVAIEFVQVFFAPRTVSLNDLAAEALGSVLGAIAGLLAAPHCAQAMAAIRRGGSAALWLMIGLYGLAYLALALFPYDFVITGDELRARLAVAASQLWTLPGWERSPLHGIAALGVSIVAAMPLGALVVRNREGTAGEIISAFVAGLLLGALIEALQAVLLCGVSDLASVLARGIGAAFGAVVVVYLRRADRPRLRRRLRPLALLALLPYLALLVVTNDLSGDGWIGMTAAAAKLAELRFIPFYYHYYTTEAVAFASAITRFAMYFPVGVLLWLWWPGAADRGSIARGIAVAAALAVGLAALCEGGRLFKSTLRPDPSNLWIAAASAGLAYALLELGWRWLMGTPKRAGAITGVADDHRRVRGTTPSIPSPATSEIVPHWQLAPAFLLALVVVAGVVLYPMGAQWLALGIVTYAAILWRWPQTWCILVPALLPTIDLAPWSGRFFFHEADLLVLTTVAVLCVRQPLFPDREALIRPSAALVVLLIAAQFIALIRGLVPVEPIGDNAFNNYFTTYNALRVAKGFGWALLLLPALISALARDPGATLRRLGQGLLISLGVVVLVSLRERSVFAGLFDFDVPFRVTGTFSSMHLGGGSMAAFLGLALPFLALPFVQPAHRLVRLTAVALVIPAVYVVLVTFNRAAYLGTVASFLVLLAALPLVLGRPERAWQPVGRLLLRRLAPVLGLVSIAIVVAVSLAVVLPGSFLSERFSRIGEDMDARLWQWQESLDLADAGPMAAIFGSGSGSYPRDFLLRNTDGRVPTTFAIAREPGADGGTDAYLRLGSGEALYFGQRVAVRPGTAYLIALSLRTASPNAKLVAPICEKSLLYSFRCEFITFTPQSPGEWERQEVEIDLSDLGRPAGFVGWLTGRPIEFALYDAVPGTTFDIDDVSLTALEGAKAGQELLVNGDFGSGTDRWFFAADNLSIWRLENFWLMTKFEQGWFGVTVLALAVAVALVRLLRCITGRPAAEAAPAAVLLASIIGFLVVGFAYGLTDATRVMTLFYLLLLAALFLGQSPMARQKVGRHDPAGPGMRVPFDARLANNGKRLSR